MSSLVKTLAAPLSVLGTVLEFEGHQQAGEAAKVAGQRRRREADFEAAQLDQQAELSVASAQRRMLEERRRANLAQSRALAVAAAGGGGASDTTVMNVISRIAAEGAYRSRVAMFEGQERARQLRMGAQAKRYGGLVAEDEGLQEEHAQDIAGLGALFKGASTLASRYK